MRHRLWVAVILLGLAMPPERRRALSGLVDQLQRA